MDIAKLERANEIKRIIETRLHTLSKFKKRVETRPPLITFSDSERNDDSDWHDRGSGYFVPEEFRPVLVRVMVAHMRLKIRELEKELEAL